MKLLLFFTLFSWAPWLLGAAPKQVAVIVPVYREFANGNLHRLVESFRNQTNENYHLFLVFNHHQEAADEAKADNFRGVEYVRSVGDGRVTIIEEFNRHNKVIGQIRQIGFAAAKVYFSSTPLKELIIAHMDADTEIENTYIEKLLHEYRDPKLDALFLNLYLRLEPGADRDLLRTTYQQRYRFAHREFEDLLFSRFFAGGPMITSTAAALQEVGGVPDIDQGEDFQLSRLLVTSQRYRLTTEVAVFTADRSRPDGYDAAERWAGLNTGLGASFIFLRNPQAAILENLLESIVDAKGVITLAEIEQSFAFVGLILDRAGWKSIFNQRVSIVKSGYGALIVSTLASYLHRYEGDFLLRSPDLGIVSQFIKVFAGTELLRKYFEAIGEAESRHNLEVANNIRILAAIFAGNESQVADEIARSEFFHENNWLRPEIESLGPDASFAQVLTHFQSQFPDWFLPFMETPIKRVYRVMEISKQTLVKLQSLGDDTYQKSVGKLRGNSMISCVGAFN